MTFLSILSIQVNLNYVQIYFREQNFCLKFFLVSFKLTKNTPEFYFVKSHDGIYYWSNSSPFCNQM